jgi:SAM-dependent methyltransferase
MHLSSFDRMQDFRDKYLKDKESETLRIVDLGSQDVNGTYKSLFDHPKWSYQGIDMAPGDNVDLVLQNPYCWKEIPSDSVDVLISGQAFEHVEYFWITMLEVARVLKPGGLACIIAPSGGHEHRYPVDCWRFYPDGFAALAKFASLDVLEVFTQWEPRGYADDSDAWKDSVLIAQKPAPTGLAAMQAAIRRGLLTLALRMR